MNKQKTFEELITGITGQYYSVDDYEWLLKLEEFYGKGLSSKEFFRDLQKARTKWNNHVFQRYQSIYQYLKERGIARTVKRKSMPIMMFKDEPPTHEFLEIVEFNYANYTKTGDREFFNSDKLYEDVLALCKLEMEGSNEPRTSPHK